MLKRRFPLKGPVAVPQPIVIGWTGSWAFARPVSPRAGLEEWRRRGRAGEVLAQPYVFSGTDGMYYEMFALEKCDPGHDPLIVLYNTKWDELEFFLRPCPQTLLSVEDLHCLWPGGAEKLHTAVTALRLLHAKLMDKMTAHEIVILN